MHVQNLIQERKRRGPEVTWGMNNSLNQVSLCVGVSEFFLC